MSTDQYGFSVAPKPPRPAARTGAALMMFGAALHIAAAFMPWYEGGGTSLNGFNDYLTDDLNVLESPGKVWVVVGIILFGLGLATYFVGRQLAIAIISVVIAVIGFFFSLLGVGAAQNTKEITGTGDAALGAFVGIISILIVITGSVHVLSRRRR